MESKKNEKREREMKREGYKHDSKKMKPCGYKKKGMKK